MPLPLLLRPLRWGILLVALAALAATGCGGTGSVTGKVNYNGTALKGGNVTFVAGAGSHSETASIQEDGTYSIPQIDAGPVTICVETASLNPAMKARAPHYSPPAGQKAPEGLGGSSEDAAKRFTEIPNDYADPAKSKLKYTVKGGTQTYNIELTGP